MDFALFYLLINRISLIIWKGEISMFGNKENEIKEYLIQEGYEIKEYLRKNGD